MASIYKSEEGERLVQQRYRQLLKHWPVPCEQRIISTCHGDTFVVTCGNEHNPPLVLFHGASGNAAVWMADVARWAEHFRIYAIDMIGHAGLSAPTIVPLNTDAHALWLDDVFRELGLTRVFVLGESLGGWLALDYATRRPGRIDKLALLVPAGVGRSKNFLLKMIPLLLLGPWGARKIPELIFGPAPKVLTPEAKYFSEFFALIMKHFLTRIIKIPQFSDAALAQLKMPVMVMLAGKEVFFDSVDAKRRLHQVVPHAKVYLDPQAFHLIRNRTVPILEFLRND